MVFHSSGSDLTRLVVGDEVQVDVTLGGLPLGTDFIFILNTRDLFPASLLQVVANPGNSSGLSPGPILAVASQRDNFNALSSFAAGSVTGIFRDSTPTPSPAIGQNGVYYSFTLRAIAPGTGAIQFDPVGSVYAANDTGFSLAPLPTGGQLGFTITAIPEPASFTMFGIGTIAIVGLVRNRRRAEPRSSTP